MNENRILSASDFMSRFTNIDFSKSDKLTNVWKKVVSKISVTKFESENSEKRMSIGERLAGNTRVVDLKNGILLIETDHSGWIQYLRTYQKFILNGLKKELPDLKISSLAFRQAGSNVGLYNSYEEQMKTESKQFYEIIEKQERKIEKENVNKAKKNVENENECTLPPEMLAKFDSIRNSVLTNSKFKWYILLLFIFGYSEKKFFKYIKEYVPWKEHINQVK